MLLGIRTESCAGYGGLRDAKQWPRESSGRNLSNHIEKKKKKKKKERDTQIHEGKY